MEVRRELEDRFGPPPPAVANLLDYAVLKALAEKLLVASIDRRGDQIAIKFYDDTPLGPERTGETDPQAAGYAPRSDRRSVAGLERRQGRRDGSREKRVATTTSVGIKFRSSNHHENENSQAFA